MSNELNSAEEFAKKLQEKIVREGLLLDNVYNADESGIYWRALSTLSLATNEDNSASEKENRVTALFCSNASGNHRLPLLMVGNFARPPYLKKLEDDPVIYRSQEGAWMDCVIFKEWFKDKFIPQVLERQEETETKGKVIIILDLAPSHPSKEKLNELHENFEVIYTPPNVSAIVQPMNQGPISVTKRLYKEALLKKLFAAESNVRIKDFMESMTLEHCFNVIAEVWGSLNQVILRKAWTPLLGDSFSVSERDSSSTIINPTLSDCNTTNTAQDIFFNDDVILSFAARAVECLSNDPQAIKDIPKISKEIHAWLEKNDGDCGWKLLSDLEIVQGLRNEDGSFLLRPGNLNPDIENGGRKMQLQPEVRPVTTEEAHECVMKLNSWLLAQPDSTDSDLKLFENLKRKIELSMTCMHKSLPTTNHAS